LPQLQEQRIAVAVAAVADLAAAKHKMAQQVDQELLSLNILPH
jgi:hypothetical protein